MADATGKPWDVSIAGQPFLYASSEEYPLIRQTAPIRKEQQDTESEPGEQSLEGWWLRSQESFHKGSGIKYQESRAVELSPSERFADSLGVDVWTPGELSLLPTLKRVTTADAIITKVADGNMLYYVESPSTLKRLSIDDFGNGTPVAVTWGGATSIRDIAFDESYYYVVATDGIYRGTIVGGVGVKIWNFATVPTSAKMAAASGFLLLLLDTKCYDITSMTGAPVLPAPFLTLAEDFPDWGLTESDGIRVHVPVRATNTSGYNFPQFIYTFTPQLSSSGWTGVRAVTLPRDEYVWSITSYYGNYLFLATDHGVRCLVQDADGIPSTIGPLSWEPLPVGDPIFETGGIATGIQTIGRYVYATIQWGIANDDPDHPMSGLVRIDPETELADLRFAWANDSYPTTQSAFPSNIPAECLAFDTRPIMVNEGDIYIVDRQNLLTSGWLKTGLIRYRTLEPKVFKLLRLRADALVGTIAATVIEDDGTETAVSSWSTQGSVDLAEASLPDIGPQEAVALRLTLTRFSAKRGPTVRAYQIKALPAPKRQRLYKLPLSVFDTERAANGTTLGYKGYALDRLEALEAAEEAGDTVSFVDNSSGVTRSVAIDDIQFRQVAPPGRTGWGGYAYVTVRTAD